MRVLVACALAALALASCSPPSNTDKSPSGIEVYYWHDDARGVSCWLYGGWGSQGKAIACLPDSQVRP